MKKYLFLALVYITSCELFGQAFMIDTIPFAGPSRRTCIEIDQSGNKWIGTTGTVTSARGVYKFDGVNWSVYNLSNSGIASNIVNCITFGNTNDIWFGTIAGLSKFDGTVWTTYNNSNSPIPNDTVNTVCYNSGKIWIGTQNGLASFDGSVWNVYNISNSGITANRITCLKADSNGDLLVGTNKGLCVKTASGWIKYTSNNSYLVDDQIDIIFVENSSVKWVGTKNSGLFKIINDNVISLNSFFNNKQLTNFNTVVCISAGPQGGILLSLDQVNAFYEIVGNQLYYYAFPPNYFSYRHVFEPVTGKVWFVGKTGGYPSNAVFTFDYSLFSNEIIVPDMNWLSFLDINQVRATILSGGDMHWNLVSAGYEVPKNSGRHSIFTSGLWMGGIDQGGDLHIAGSTYRQTGNDYWPGPLDTITGGTDSITSFNYSKIWKLNKWEIDEFRTMFANGSVSSGAYTPAYNIIHWPAHGGGAYTNSMAPFVDMDNDGIYDPMADGDYPLIKGDQMCYWIFNDNLKPHTESGGNSLGVEVHASAYAYNCDTIGDSLKALNFTTFYDYEIYNRSSNNYHNTYISLWQDNDLGGYDDDQHGCNPSGNYSFSYNGDSVDQSLSNVIGYGPNPPMYSNVILNGPYAEPGDGIDNDNDNVIDETGEKNLMTHVLNYNNSSNPVNGNPNMPQDYYNYMRSTWQDGSPLVYGGWGTGPGTPHNFMYDGLLDGTPWSEISEAHPFVDKRINMSCGPFNLNASQHVNFSFAIVYTRDNNPTYSITNLYNKNLADVNRIRQWYNNDNFPTCNPEVTSTVNFIVSENILELYPNPAGSELWVKCNYVSPGSYIGIYDVTGKLVMEIRNNLQKELILDVSQLNKGLYILKLSNENGFSVKKFIKQ